MNPQRVSSPGLGLYSDSDSADVATGADPVALNVQGAALGNNFVTGDVGADDADNEVVAPAVNAVARGESGAKRFRIEIPITILNGSSDIAVGDVGVFPVVSSLEEDGSTFEDDSSVPQDEAEYRRCVDLMTVRHSAACLRGKLLRPGDTAGGAGPGGKLTELETQVSDLLSDALLLVETTGVDTGRLPDGVQLGILRGMLLNWFHTARFFTFFFHYR